GMARHQIEVGAARRDGDRFAQSAAEHHGRDAVGKEEMRIDQVEIIAVALDGARRAQRRLVEAEGRQIDAELGNDGVARMLDRDAAADLLPRRLCIGGVAAEKSARAGKPGNRCQHTRFGAAAVEQEAQPCLDEDAVGGLRRVGIERREGEDAHHSAAARCTPSIWPSPASSDTALWKASRRPARVGSPREWRTSPARAGPWRVSRGWPVRRASSCARPPMVVPVPEQTLNTSGSLVAPAVSRFMARARAETTSETCTKSRSCMPSP